MSLGLLVLPWWGYVLVVLCMTHATIAAVTIYLHRHQAHRALELHPAVAHAFRFWLWLTTAMVTREWAAVHRKHHAEVERPEDPHSPQQVGIRTVLLRGAELYRSAADRQELLRQYGHGTPDDLIERRLYSRHPSLGIALMFALDVALFGPIGITIWAVQMAWIPFFAAGVINGVGHWAGYRNFESADASRNIVPFGILIGGEELHNNHHAWASSAKFSARWWELDVGWLYIRALAALGLARVKKVAPRRYVRGAMVAPDYETVRALVSARLQVMADYAQQVVRRVYREEVRRTAVPGRLIAARGLLNREAQHLTGEARARLERALAANGTLVLVLQYRERLQALWSERNASQEALLAQLQEWCRQAEASGVQALADFARSLRGYALVPA